jgi:hypothetical protein
MLTISPKTIIKKQKKRKQKKTYVDGVRIRERTLRVPVDEHDIPAPGHGLADLNAALVVLAPAPVRAPVWTQEMCALGEILDAEEATPAPSIWLSASVTPYCSAYWACLAVSPLTQPLGRLVRRLGFVPGVSTIPLAPMVFTNSYACSPDGGGGFSPTHHTLAKHKITANNK